MKTYRYILLSLVVVSLFLCFGCAVDSSDDDDDSNDTVITDSGDTSTPIFTAIPLVRIQTSAGNSITVEVELARTSEEQSRGLMFRESLGAFAGMLFIFDTEALWDFTMENTLIPLDMIHLDANQVVVGIVRDAVPNTLGPYNVDVASLYVLEVNGGFAVREGIEIGNFVSFSGFTP